MKCSKKVESILDNIMWYVIYLLPLIIYIFNIKGTDISSLQDFLSSFVSNNNFVYVTLDFLFGAHSSILEVFSNSAILLYLSYFINCVIVHLIVDFILVLPRICHKLLDKVVK